ncbi:uncharacterized protein LOC124373152 [Homalodisca vitripennis]|uniref:uncharacterized protein LOC124373152 n=1 Tax=Homalodisca vitripennis TaxID=197043 RepID=UPI001EEA640A|nr:uncharacterized protein LOC124373152 [Homalodisca vitripennis]XP_046687515.1 uncharacterized protein LOC124373152 [Homalodisca vitripennis]
MSETPGRPMKYPYTISAKVAQFPFKFYYNNHWIFKYWFFGILASAPLFYKIGKLSYSPDNVAKWEKIRHDNFSGHHEH